MQKMRDLERICLSEKPTIVVGKEVKEQIKYLCNKIKRLEWSGVLFYTIKGSIKNPSKMIIYLHHILLMDIGTKGYTTFKWNEDGAVADFIMSNDEAFEWTMGHIHSHNDMQVFFSVTDWSELNDNSPLHNMYLSVIINNFLDIKAKIAFVGTPTLYVCKNEKGKDYKLYIEVESNTMFVIDCDIKDLKPAVLPTDFEQRFTAIEEAKKAKVHNMPNNTSKSYSGNGMADWGKPVAGQPYARNINNEATKNSVNYLDGVDDVVTIPYVEEILLTHNAIVAKFTAYILRMGIALANDTPFDALNDYASADINMIYISDNIISNIDLMFEQYFNDATKSKIQIVMEEVIEILYTEASEFEWLGKDLLPKLKKKYSKPVALIGV